MSGSGSSASQISANDGTAIHNIPQPTSTALPLSRLATAAAMLPNPAMTRPIRGMPSAAAITLATTMTTIPVRMGAPARQRRLHSQAINPAATATTAESSGGPNHAAASPTGASTRAESTRCRNACALFAPALPSSRGPGPSCTAALSRANGCAVSAVAAMEIPQRRLEIALGEIGPQRLGEDEFGVGRLPQQEIADPLLAAGANDEVGIRHEGRQQMLADRHLVDRFGIELAIGERDGELQSGILARQRLAVFDQRDDVWRQTRALTDDAQAHTVAMNLGDLAAQVMAQQSHQPVDLGGRSPPVLRGEAEKGQIGDL